MVYECLYHHNISKHSLSYKQWCCMKQENTFIWLIKTFNFSLERANLSIVIGQNICDNLFTWFSHTKKAWQDLTMIFTPFESRTESSVTLVFISLLCYINRVLICASDKAIVNVTNILDSQTLICTKRSLGTLVTNFTQKMPECSHSIYFSIFKLENT